MDLDTKVINQVSYIILTSVHLLEKWHWDWYKMQRVQLFQEGMERLLGTGWSVNLLLIQHHPCWSSIVSFTTVSWSWLRQVRMNGSLIQNGFKFEWVTWNMMPFLVGLRAISCQSVMMHGLLKSFMRNYTQVQKIKNKNEVKREKEKALWSNKKQYKGRCHNISMVISPMTRNVLNVKMNKKKDD